MLEQLSWWHAFGRHDTPSSVYADILLHGPRPMPGRTTANNEAILGITPPRVYAYLGVPAERFGDAALAFAQGDIDGEVSPFDSGSLVAHMPLVRDLDPARKRDFLNSFTFPVGSLRTELDTYPTSDGARIANYLRGRFPGVAGPHHLWTTASGDALAVWEEAEREPGVNSGVWTWEARVPGGLPCPTKLLGWACSAARVDEVREIARKRMRLYKNEPWVPILRKLMPGGVSKVVADIQAAAEGRFDAA